MAAVTVYVPTDTSARSLGAEAVARAIARSAAAIGREVRIVRNGSRGLYWLEPLVEVKTPGGRVAYGPVNAADVPGLIGAGMLEGKAHALCHGDISQHPFLAGQQRLTFARVGVIDPLDVTDYQAHGGYRGLQRALTLKPAEIVREMTDSGLRGRGGAAFPTGIKWQTVLDQPAGTK